MWRLVCGCGEQQVPPLRYAPVGMTILFWVLGFVTENSGGPRGAPQIPRLPRISCRELRLRSTACGSSLERTA